MKNILFVLILLSVTWAKPQGSIWKDTFDEAMAQAQQENKVVLIAFSGSDWCPGCIRLEKQVFSQKLFTDKTQDDIVAYYADFPRTQRLPHRVSSQNFLLKEQYAKDAGFPAVVLIRPNGEFLDFVKYRGGGPMVFIKELKKVLDKHLTQGPMPQG